MNLKVCVCVCGQSFSCAWLFMTPWPTARFLCPRDFPGKITGVGWDFLLQRIFLSQNQTCVSVSPTLAGRFFTTWHLGSPNFEDIILSEIGQHKRTNTVWFHLYEVSRIVEFINMERRVVSREQGEGRIKSC